MGRPRGPGGSFQRLPVGGLRLSTGLNSSRAPKKTIKTVRAGKAQKSCIVGTRGIFQEEGGSIVDMLSGIASSLVAQISWMRGARSKRPFFEDDYGCNHWPHTFLPNFSIIGVSTKSGDTRLFRGRPRFPIASVWERGRDLKSAEPQCRFCGRNTPHAYQMKLSRQACDLVELVPFV